MAQISKFNKLAEEEEAKYKAELGDDYAPPDEPTTFDSDSIGFDFHMFPTLHDMALDESRLKFVIGPAGCLPHDTEVLTRFGWRPISELPTEILVYDGDTHTAFFEKPSPVKLPNSEGFHRFHTSYSLDMVVSDEHRVWYQTRYSQSRGENKWQVVSGFALAEQYKGGSKLDAKIPTVFDLDTDTEYPLSNVELQIQVMLSADGHLPARGSKAYVTVRKERKKERIRALLSAAGIEYTETVYPQRPTETRFKFTPPEWNKDLSKYYRASKAQLLVMAEESLLWDGHIGSKGSYYTSNNKANVDFIQFAFASNGVSSTVAEQKSAKHPEWNTTYRVTISMGGKTQWVNLKTAEYDHVPSDDGFKYCYTTSTGMFVTRRNGKILVTGNSAKTSGIIWQLLIKAIEQAPASDGVRYSKALVVRNTNIMLRSTTIPSFRTMLGNLMTFRLGSYPLMGHLRCDLSDGTKVHFDIEFMAFDDEKSQNKLLGCEPTFAFLDELSELPESLVFAVDRRMGRYPSGRFGRPTWVGMFGATNGPLKNHWLYKWYLGEKDKEFDMISERSGRKYFTLFRQPPALLRRSDGQWSPNPNAENIEHLPDGYNYYYAMLGAEEQKIKAYVEGEFADLVTGKVVFPEFSEERHVIPKIALPGGAPLCLSFDFGRTPVCLVATYTTGGRLIVVDEVMGEDMSVETLTLEHVKPLLKQRYAYNLVELATGDPSGITEAQSVDISPFDVLRKYGIPIESPGTNKIQPRIEAVKQRLKQLDREGKPMLQITDNCKFLIEALKYNYIYESVRGKNDVVRDTPTKSHEGWVSDLCDALQYLCIYTGIVHRERPKNPRSTRRARFI